MGAWTASLAAVASLVAWSACPGASKSVVYDLADRVRVAERWSSRDVILFGTPASEPHQAEGFYREAGRPAGDPYVWSRGEAEVSLSLTGLGPRSVVVDLAPYRGVKSQAVEVRLNGTSVGRFALNDGRHRYVVPLPVEAQKPGDNRLRFVFQDTASPSRDTGSDDKRELAAAFYSLVAGSADDPGLLDLLGRDAPRPFAGSGSDPVPALVQVGPASVRYAVKLPAGAELRFTPDLDPRARAAAGRAHFRVTLEGEGGTEREIWSRLIDASDPKPGEVILRLPGSPGDIVRVGLHLGAASSGRFAWGTWRAPRILGRLEPGTSDRGAAARATQLRQARGEMNVILVVLDAARAQQLTCYGYPRPTTPEIDRMASEGVVFERAFTPAVYTLGAMSSVWTSQYPDRHHAEVSYADRLPAGKLTLAEALGALGIRTAGFVANPMAGKAMGFERGFSEFTETFGMFPDLGSRGEAVSRVVPEWLARHKTDRFFAYVHFREPHFPYDPGPPFDTRFGPDAPLTNRERRDKAWYTDVNQGRVKPTTEQIEHLVRLYDGNLAYVDREVGRLRQALEENGLLENTVLIVAADHGEQLYEAGYISHSAQVREESTHIPLVIRFPAGRGPKGVRVRPLVDLLDVAPTVMDLFGLRGKGTWERSFQGTSLLEILGGHGGKPAVLSRTVWDRPVYAYRDARFKYVFDTRTGAGRLFDLEQDPREARDTAREQNLRAAFYRESLLQWVGGLSDAGQGAGSTPAARMTREQCEELKALGYTHAGCP